GENLGHGETGCLHIWGLNGLDVTNYSTLRLRVSFNIQWQSLPICGVAASECPVMVEISYLNEWGQPRTWIQGFYALSDGAVPGTRDRCDTCLQPHERVTGGNWYTFESGNLFNLQEGFRPTTITQIRFYTSGHAYDVYVGEVG